VQSGTYRVAQAVTTSAQDTLVFGKRTVAMAELLNVLEPFRSVSRSGDAALSLMAGSVLPGVESLRS
jgi:3-phosphoglycerate kinase